MPSTPPTRATTWRSSVTSVTLTGTDATSGIDHMEWELDGAPTQSGPAGTVVEIVSGAREGMYINTSGNARHGQAFVRSVKDGVEQHIYGSGDDRVVVSNKKS